MGQILFFLQLLLRAAGVEVITEIQQEQMVLLEGLAGAGARANQAPTQGAQELLIKGAQEVMLDSKIQQQVVVALTQQV
jgi:hypothetical protein